MDYSLLSFVDITETAAISCYPLIGLGDSKGADQQAVSAMRTAFNKRSVDIQIVIGEGERDQAPRLYTGELLGDQKSPVKLDIAVDPLEGTTLCAEARPGALSVMAVAQRGELFKAPDIYMKKIACGPEAKEFIDLKAPVEDNIACVAKALGKKTNEITVGVLNRPRHQDLIQNIRKAKARVKLVGDGDIALSLETALGSSSLDLLMGIGG
ncbi:MAG: fructose-bisphosphatase class II, partial [Oligoflexia bacterium]|nr:fructose-bisphosphatase class II [Oligoflexia bacterium]